MAIQFWCVGCSGVECNGRVGGGSQFGKQKGEYVTSAEEILHGVGRLQDGAAGASREWIAVALKYSNIITVKYALCLQGSNLLRVLGLFSNAKLVADT